MERTVNSDEMTQATYRETPYEDQTWEIVGEITASEEFQPMEVATIDGEKICIDPMFPDYGGRYGDPNLARPYLKPGETLKRKSVEEEEAEQGIIRVHRDDIERAIREAGEKARLEAVEQLVEENERKMQRVEETLLTVFKDYQVQVTEILSALEKKAVELAVSISEKIIGYAVEINPEYIIPLIKEAFKLAGSSHIAKVRVSPQDLEFIEVLGIQKIIREFTDINFVGDESIRSGCVVETTAGEIDYQIDKSWDRIKDSVVKAVS
ncbi:MAG: hypothetical protein GYA55_12855 [SAR324 cluster bacterium]|uniref:Flagellar assembly protein FliH/Type III secretion system HrpE domain-containing protein n=1 Tax=SAR324 cluster bacterium TaxID=2024889 RepID=A0A7X9IKT9_9DELT|nr:hypothetical protein [SAR324 cluster bacterium]